MNNKLDIGLNFKAVNSLLIFAAFRYVQYSSNYDLKPYKA
ncbi:hypothetical protein SC08_Contig83orf02180 [Clostridium butyricum]|nr:hypothetical protein SC08_Contig83orf02180 [Clostridium butyricum]